MKKVQAITDGSCLGNPGRGGWACILRFGKHKKEMYGSDPDTTKGFLRLHYTKEIIQFDKQTKVFLVSNLRQKPLIHPPNHNVPDLEKKYH